MSENPTHEPEHILLHADRSIKVSEEEKKRREREWLLADIDPSPLIERMRREREMNAQWDANREAMDRAADRLTDQAIPEWLQSRPMDIPVTDTPVFTEPGPGAAQMSDGTPEQLAAWIEKRQARLIELTGFDLRVPPEGDDGPERPVSGEEKSG